jgi:transcriptional regulator with XRE-family HTH domain
MSDAPYEASYDASFDASSGFCVLSATFLEHCGITPAVLRWHLGDVVRKLREEKGFDSANKLALKARVDRSTVYRLEGGGNSDDETIEAIAAVFGLTGKEMRALVPTQAQELDRVADFQTPEDLQLMAGVDDVLQGVIGIYKALRVMSADRAEAWARDVIGRGLQPDTGSQPKSQRR